MARSECARCKIMFSSVTAFDAHLRWKDGAVTHVDPAGIPELRRRDDGIWAGVPRGNPSWREVPFSGADSAALAGE